MASDEQLRDDSMLADYAHSSDAAAIRRQVRPLLALAGWRIFSLIERVSGVFEVVPALVRAEGVERASDGGPERLTGATGGLAQERLQLG